MQQISRFTDEELELIKKTFKDNNPLLKALRNHILQLPLSAIEQSLLQINVKNKPAMLKIIRAKVLPELDADVPFGLSSDLWLTLPVREVDTDRAMVQIQACRIWHNYLDQQLKLLEGKEVAKPFKLSSSLDLDGKTPEQAHACIIARNLIITGTEAILGTFISDAIGEQETKEQREERLKKDSSK